MATAESVKAKINNLIAKANAATGKSDTDLTSGINSLIDGFGKSETVEIFDGTINIESGFTTISGSYVIDQQKAYDALLTLTKTKTYNVAFGAGGPANGGDEINFTSMTFDKEYGLIKYNDKAAFAMNGGFAEYNNNYGDGNGARVNFEEGTECRKEFKELFLSIADEYVESEVTDELAGTWAFNDTISRLNGDYYGTGLVFTCNGETFDTIRDEEDADPIDYLKYARWDPDYLSWTAYNFRSDSWSNSAYKTITIISTLAEVYNGSALLTWLKANATKQGSAKLISFTIEGTSYQAEEGMTWGEWVASDYNTSTYALDGSIVYNGHGSWVQLNGQSCSGTDFIIDGATYVHVYASGSN